MGPVMCICYSFLNITSSVHLVATLLCKDSSQGLQIQLGFEHRYTTEKMKKMLAYQKSTTEECDHEKNMDVSCACVRHPRNNSKSNDESS